MKVHSPIGNRLSSRQMKWTKWAEISREIFNTWKKILSRWKEQKARGCFPKSLGLFLIQGWELPFHGSHRDLVWYLGTTTTKKNVFPTLVKIQRRKCTFDLNKIETTEIWQNTVSQNSPVTCFKGNIIMSSIFYPLQASLIYTCLDTMGKPLSITETMLKRITLMGRKLLTLSDIFFYNIKPMQANLWVPDLIFCQVMQSPNMTAW